MVNSGWPPAAFLDTLKARRNGITSAVKSILQDLDNQLKRLIEEHVDSLQQPVPEPLLKNLLYYVARAADVDSPQVRKVVERYQLERALPSEQVLSRRPRPGLRPQPGSDSLGG